MPYKNKEDARIQKREYYKKNKKKIREYQSVYYKEYRKTLNGKEKEKARQETKVGRSSPEASRRRSHSRQARCRHRQPAVQRYTGHRIHQRRHRIRRPVREIAGSTPASRPRIRSAQNRLRLVAGVAVPLVLIQQISRHFVQQPKPISETRTSLVPTGWYRMGRPFAWAQP